MINKRKNILERGITLIALVVTIIVLLILAGVTLNIAIDNGGLISRAKEASKEKKIGDEKEILSLAYSTVKLDKIYNNDNSLISSGELRQELSNEGYRTSVTGNGTLIVEFLDTHNVYTVTSEGIVENRKPIEFPSGLQIGSNVKYEPTGGEYNWLAQYATSKESEDTNLYSTESGTGQNVRNTNWKVFKIDSYSGLVQLVPNDPLGIVKLDGAQGYNNGVKMLNDACSALYSYPEKNITARSINIDDIEDLLDENKLKDVKDRSGYNKKIEEPLTTNNLFPRIYEEEKNCTINGTEKSEGLKLSESGGKLYSRNETTTLINQTTNTEANKGYFKANSSIQPYKTSYYWSNALDNSENYKQYGQEYSIMLDKTFYLASRCVYRSYNNDYVQFSISRIHGGTITNDSVFYSKAATQAALNPSNIFPVVTMDYRLISPDGNSFKVDL